MQKLLLERISSRTFRLCQDFESECGIHVPYGFISDGLSAPLLLRGFVLPTGKGFNAALVHDYLLQAGEEWKVANSKFKQQLILDGLEKWRIFLYMSGVTIWAFFKEF